MMDFLIIGNFEIGPKDDGAPYILCKSGELPGLKYQPVLAKPLDITVVNSLLKEISKEVHDVGNIPHEWGIRWAEGYLECNRHFHSIEAAKLIIRIVELTGAVIADRLLFFVVPLQAFWNEQPNAIVKELRL